MGRGGGDRVVGGDLERFKNTPRKNIDFIPFLETWRPVALGRRVSGWLVVHVAGQQLEGRLGLRRRLRLVSSKLGLSVQNSAGRKEGKKEGRKEGGTERRRQAMSFPSRYLRTG